MARSRSCSEDPDLIEIARPALAAMGRKIVPTGPRGSGHAMKALNNYVAVTGFAAVAEALIVGERFGLDPTRMVTIMNVSTGRNFMTDLVMKPHVVDGAFATGFALALLAKDVGIAESLVGDLKLDMALLRQSAQMWREARDGCRRAPTIPRPIRPGRRAPTNSVLYRAMSLRAPMRGLQRGLARTIARAVLSAISVPPCARSLRTLPSAWG